MHVPFPRRGPAPPAAPRRRRHQAVALAGVTTIVGTVMAMALWFAGPFLPGDQQTAAPAAGREQPTAQPVADPASVHVASRGIAADTIALGKHDDGSLEVPESADIAGWWTGGANPGERGASVIVGHVDSRDGPGAFFGLSDVAAGERLTIMRADGSSVHFRVGRVETHPKDAFPTEAVYGHTDAPTLRLVTCAGPFDPAARSYEDNVIVFADLEEDEAGTPVRTLGGQVGGSEGFEAAGAPDATTPGPGGRRLPVGLATLSVIGAATAVTCQALRSRGSRADPGPTVPRGHV